MGREIRRVPENWQHPVRDPENDTFGRGGYQPMYDQTFDDAFDEWLSEFDRVRSGDLRDYETSCYPDGLASWLEDNPPPERCFYRPYTDDQAPWFQAYETVSEGTPVSPPFATRGELVDYLSANGDFWDQDRGNAPASREAYEAFVAGGWAPSMVMVGSRVMSGVDALVDPDLKQS